jgi:hypothetical protein
MEYVEDYFARVSKNLAFVAEDIFKSASNSEELDGMMKYLKYFG